MAHSPIYEIPLPECVFARIVWITPDAATAAATAVAPAVAYGPITPAAAEAAAVAVAPEVISGAITPTAASAIATAVAPTTVLGSVSITPTAATSIAASVAPTVLTQTTVTPSAATSVAEAVTPTVTITGTAVLPATHWFLDTQNNGWFKQSFTKIAHDPVAMCSYDGDAPDDRVVLIGSDDGYIRYFDPDSALDDTDNMTAFVTLGPLTGNQGAVPLVLREVQGVTDQNSHAVLYEILAGDEPETALGDEDDWFDGDGTFAAGLSKVYNPRTSGYYIYTKVGHTSANAPWSLEGVRTRCSAVATSRGRHE